MIWLKVVLALIAGALWISAAYRGDGKLVVYWMLVMAYWSFNAIGG